MQDPIGAKLCSKVEKIIERREETKGINRPNALTHGEANGKGRCKRPFRARKV